MCLCSSLSTSYLLKLLNEIQFEVIFEKLKIASVGLRARWQFSVMLLRPMWWVNALPHVDLALCSQVVPQVSNVLPNFVPNNPKTVNIFMIENRKTGGRKIKGKSSRYLGGRTHDSQDKYLFENQFLGITVGYYSKNNWVNLIAVGIPNFWQ